MSNSPLLTEIARSIAELDISGYMNGVAAHVGGDWGQHACVRVYTGSTGTYTDESSVRVSDTSLRLSVTHVSTDIDLLVPIIQSGSAATPGSVPIIIAQPASATAAAGSSIQIFVTAISSETPTYSWRNITSTPYEVSGGNSSVLVFNSVTTAINGTYSCVVENSFGSVESSAAVVTVTG